MTALRTGPAFFPETLTVRLLPAHRRLVPCQP